MDVWQAAAAGDVSFVRSFLAAEPDLLDALDEAQFSPLHYAAAYNHIDVIEFLIAAGAQVDGQQRTKTSSPLCIAVAHAQHEAVAKLISWNAIDKQDIVLLRHLLSAGADVNRRLSVEWATPLFAAVYLHAHDLVSLLLSYNADPNIGRQGRSPLALALTRGDVAMAKLLFYSGANPNDPPLSVSFTLLSSVRSTGGPWCELLHLLICHGANLNVHTPLSQFERIVLDFRIHDLDMVTYLIAHGADLNFRTWPAVVKLGAVLQMPNAEDWKEEDVRCIASQRWMEKL